MIFCDFHELSAMESQPAGRPDGRLACPAMEPRPGGRLRSWLAGWLAGLAGMIFFDFLQQHFFKRRLAGDSGRGCEGAAGLRAQ
jgi:hypothetical protein